MLKDVLREYEGQEAHTVHLVFTPKTLPPLSRGYKEQQQKLKSSPGQSQTSSEMNSNELRQRNTATTATSSNDNRTPTTTTTTTNIPNNYYNAFYASGMPQDQNSLLAQQYAMQTWMQQAYAQYINQYMNM